MRRTASKRSRRRLSHASVAAAHNSALAAMALAVGVGVRYAGREVNWQAILPPWVWRPPKNLAVRDDG